MLNIQEYIDKFMYFSYSHLCSFKEFNENWWLNFCTYRELLLMYAEITSATLEANITSKQLISDKQLKQICTFFIVNLYLFGLVFRTEGMYPINKFPI